MLPCLLLSVGLIAGETSSPVGIVLSIKGTVTVERGKDKVALENADLLVPGDRLTAAEQGEAVLFFFKEARRQRLRSGKQATVGAKGCDPMTAIEEVETGHVPSAASLRILQEHSQAVHAVGGRAAVGVLRGGPTSIPAVKPMAGARVLTDHPTLSWPALKGAESYLVELLPAVEGGSPLWRVTTKEARLPYPEEQSVLKRGLRYRWRVTTKVGSENKEIVYSSFFPVAEDRSRELARLNTLAESTDAGDWLLAAMSYESAGVFDKALPLFERLAEAAPRVANYHEALARYYQRAGRPDKAREAEKRAQDLRQNDRGAK